MPESDSKYTDFLAQMGLNPDGTVQQAPSEDDFDFDDYDYEEDDYSAGLKKEVRPTTTTEVRTKPQPEIPKQETVPDPQPVQPELQGPARAMPKGWGGFEEVPIKELMTEKRFGHFNTARQFVSDMAQDNESLHKLDDALNLVMKRIHPRTGGFVKASEYASALGDIASETFKINRNPEKYVNENQKDMANAAGYLETWALDKIKNLRSEKDRERAFAKWQKLDKAEQGFQPMKQRTSKRHSLENIYIRNRAIDLMDDTYGESLNREQAGDKAWQEWYQIETLADMNPEESDTIKSNLANSVLQGMPFNEAMEYTQKAFSNKDIIREVTSKLGDDVSDISYDEVPDIVRGSLQTTFEDLPQEFKEKNLSEFQAFKENVMDAFEVLKKVEGQEINSTDIEKAKIASRNISSIIMKILVDASDAGLIKSSEDEEDVHFFFAEMLTVYKAILNAVDYELGVDVTDSFGYDPNITIENRAKRKENIERGLVNPFTGKPFTRRYPRKRNISKEKAEEYRAEYDNLTGKERIEANKENSRINNIYNPIYSERRRFMYNMNKAPEFGVNGFWQQYLNRNRSDARTLQKDLEENKQKVIKEIAKSYKKALSSWFGEDYVNMLFENKKASRMQKGIDLLNRSEIKNKHNRMIFILLRKYIRELPELFDKGMKLGKEMFEEEYSKLTDLEKSVMNKPPSGKDILYGNQTRPGVIDLLRSSPEYVDPIGKAINILKPLGKNMLRYAHNELAEKGIEREGLFSRLREAIADENLEDGAYNIDGSFNPDYEFEKTVRLANIIYLSDYFFDIISEG